MDLIRCKDRTSLIGWLEIGAEVVVTFSHGIPCGALTMTFEPYRRVRWCEDRYYESWEIYEDEREKKRDTKVMETLPKKLEIGKQKRSVKSGSAGLGNWIQELLESTG